MTLGLAPSESEIDGVDLRSAGQVSRHFQASSLGSSLATLVSWESRMPAVVDKRHRYRITLACLAIATYLSVSFRYKPNPQASKSSGLSQKAKAEQPKPSRQTPTAKSQPKQFSNIL